VGDDAAARDRVLLHHFQALKNGFYQYG
jgi:hypothetical protein